MPKVCYLAKRFSAAHAAIVEYANEIIHEYDEQGFSLTLRQLYYQFVSRDLIANTQREYKRLGGIINDARLAGLIDWSAIEDRTRTLRVLPHWCTPEDIIYSSANQFRIDKWAKQDHRLEVWIEKDALTGVIEDVCRRMDVPYFSCRGYTSQSEMWGCARRMASYVKRGQTPVIIHLGDHDPSGIDMTRDIDKRLEMFMGGMKINRIALNMDQVEQYNPPPNPAKITDSRAASYISIFGHSSWELDALEPREISGLTLKTIESYMDQDAWLVACQEEEQHIASLAEVSERWPEILAMLGNK